MWAGPFPCLDPNCSLSGRGRPRRAGRGVDNVVRPPLPTMCPPARAQNLEVTVRDAINSPPGDPVCVASSCAHPVQEAPAWLPIRQE